MLCLIYPSHSTLNLEVWALFSLSQINSLNLARHTRLLRAYSRYHKTPTCILKQNELLVTLTRYSTRPLWLSVLYLYATNNKYRSCSLQQRVSSAEPVGLHSNTHVTQNPEADPPTSHTTLAARQLYLQTHWRLKFNTLTSLPTIPLAKYHSSSISCHNFHMKA